MKQKKKITHYHIIIFFSLCFFIFSLFKDFISFSDFFNDVEDFSKKKITKTVWALYNPLYGNPGNDGKFIGWRYKKSKYWDNWYEAPLNISSKIYPKKGLYSTHDKTILDLQMQELVDIGVAGIIVQWKGYNRSTIYNDEPPLYPEETISLLLEAAIPYNIKVGVLLQSYEWRSNSSIGSDLEYVLKNWSSHKQYLTYNDRPVIFIYDPHECHNVYYPMEKQKKYYNPFFVATFSKQEHISLAVESGFDAVFTYSAFKSFSKVSDPSNWDFYHKDCVDREILFIPAVTPGFDEIQSDSALRFKISRNGSETYKTTWESSLKNNDGIIIINSYNNWQELTNIEPAIYRQNYEFTNNTWSGSDGHSDDFLTITKQYISNFYTNS